jgi:hypothetical protein
MPTPVRLSKTAVLGVATDVLATDEGGRDGLGAGHVEVLPAAHQIAAVDRCQSPGWRRKSRRSNPPEKVPCSSGISSGRPQ